MKKYIKCNCWFSLYRQLSSFKCSKDCDQDTTELVKAFTDHNVEQIWHSDKYDEETIKINVLTKKKSLDLWDLPRAELPSHVQLSPDSKVNLHVHLYHEAALCSFCWNCKLLTLIINN